MTATKNIININIFGATAHAILCNFHAASEQRGALPSPIPGFELVTTQKTNPGCQRKQLQTDMKIMVRRGISRAVVTM